jgi:hypothetical protein
MALVTTSSEGRSRPRDSAILQNPQTVELYERCARDYAHATAPHADSPTGQTLHRFMQQLEPGSSVI